MKHSMKQKSAVGTDTVNKKDPPILVFKFVPFFPPHTGGMESHVEERSNWRYKKGFGYTINITSPIGQNIGSEDSPIMYQGVCIGYQKQAYEVIILDAFELIPIFIIPKFRTKKFRLAWSYLANKLKNTDKKYLFVHTHTRFFLSSLVGGLFARIYSIKRIHIEHGVDFVRLNSRRKNAIAWIYDQIVGRLIFRQSDILIGISEGCKKFVRFFTRKKISVIHRGVDIDIPHTPRVERLGEVIRMGFVGRLVTLKGVDVLINAFARLQQLYQNLSLDIVGDGDQRFMFEQLVNSLGLGDKIHFVGYKDRTYIVNEFLPMIDILVNASYQEGLPTSVLEGLLSGCVVVATDVGGTVEISDQKDLILVKKGDVNSLKIGLEYAIQHYESIQGLSRQEVQERFDRNKNIEKYRIIMG